MGKIEHLQFLVLLLPTFIILGAAAISMADLAFPSTDDAHPAMHLAISSPIHSGELAGDANWAE